MSYKNMFISFTLTKMMNIQKEVFFATKGAKFVKVGQKFLPDSMSAPIS